VPIVGLFSFFYCRAFVLYLGLTDPGPCSVRRLLTSEVLSGCGEIDRDGATILWCHVEVTKFERTHEEMRQIREREKKAISACKQLNSSSWSFFLKRFPFGGVAVLYGCALRVSLC
jgi:hypothetical protein